MDRATFANQIKTKYPEYANMDDNMLVDKMLQKYPQYKSQIKEVEEPIIETPKTSTASKVLDYAQNVGKEFEAGASKLTTNLKKVGQDYSQNVAEGDVMGATKDLLRGGLRTAGTVTEQAFTPITEIPVVKNAMNFIVQKFGDTEQGKQLVSMIQKNPEKAQDIMDIINVATLGTAKELSAPLGKFATQAVDKVGDVAMAGARTIASPIIGGAEAVSTGTKRISDFATTKVQNTKKTLNMLQPKNYDEAVLSIEEAYKSAFVDNKVGINKQLTKLGNLQGKTPDDLIYTLAKEGIVPDLEGKLAKFDNAFGEIRTKKQEVFQGIDVALKEYSQYKPKVNIDDFKYVTETYLQSSPSINPANIESGLTELDQIFNGLRIRYGDEVDLRQLNQIRQYMNDLTKAHDTPAFRQDVSNAIGDVVRDSIDANVENPLIRQANKEYGRLKEIEQIIKVFDNQPVDAGLLGTQLGRLGGAMTLGMISLPFTAGAGSLAIAGIFAVYGGDFIANLLRQNKFNKKAKQIIIEQLAQEPNVVDELISEASKENARYLRQTLLPEPAIRMGGETKEGGIVDLAGNVKPKDVNVKIDKAGKYPVSVDPETGKFQTMYNQGTKDIKPSSIPTKYKKDWGNVEKFTSDKSPLVKKNYAILTAENPMAKELSVAENIKLNKKLYQRLIEDGFEPIPVQGQYGRLENSFIVPEMSESMAKQYGIDFNQESVLTPKGLIYQDGTVNPADLSKINYNSSQEDFFTTVNIDGKDVKFSIPIDFETKIPLKDLKKNSNKVNKANMKSSPAVLGLFSEDLKDKVKGYLGMNQEVQAEEPTDEELYNQMKSKLTTTLMDLESSGGKDKSSADEGELKWLTGLTNVAIKDLKRVGLIDNIDINNKEEVLDASAKYFTYLMSRNPNKTPAEVYVDKYWNGWKKLKNGKEIRQKKIDQFNSNFNS